MRVGGRRLSNGTPPPSPAIAAGADALALVAPERLARMPRHIYRLRILGMGLGGIAIAAVLREHDAGWPLWTLWAGTALLWPHLALWIALRSAHPYRAEVRNLLFDSLLAGLWAPLMHFDLLPSVLLLTLATVDKISTGIPGCGCTRCRPPPRAWPPAPSPPGWRSHRPPAWR